MVDSADDGSTTKGSEDVVLEEAIGRFSWQRKRQRLRLSNSELHLDAVDGGRQHSLRISDIVGAEIVGEADAAAGAASNRRLMVYAYPRQSLCCRGLVRVAQHLELSVSSTDGELVDGRSLAEGWCNTINAVASGAGAAAIAAAADLQPAAVPRRRRFLVFVNPASGRRRALHLYRSVVEPLFREARIDALLVVTEGRDHAYTFVKDYAREDLVQFDAIVTIGGDGTLSEVVNGIGARSEASMIFESVPLGVIRGGSGNGVAVSLLKAAEESLDVLSSTFAVIKGRAHPFDLSQVEHPAAGRGDSSDGLLDQAPLDLEASVVEKKRKLGFLSLTWGLISDIDIESERCRCVGEARFTLYPLYCVARLRPYEGSVYIYDSTNAPAALESSDGTTLRSRVPLPSLEEPIACAAEGTPGWRLLGSSVNGAANGFISVVIAQCAWIATDAQIAPAAGCGQSGDFHVLAIRHPVSRARILSMFLDIERAGHLNETYSGDIEYYRALAYRVVPGSAGGHVVLDGEELPYGVVQGAILPGAARLLQLRGEEASG
uniref:DAGKc domain-containing protein n=1 Tax=Pinguiococcus pyrenoidosus TaxID=172671 RepID=A0A7R9UFA7_9STRA